MLVKSVFSDLSHRWIFGVWEAFVVFLCFMFRIKFKKFYFSN